MAGNTPRKATKKTAKATTQTVQAAVEGVVDTQHIEFMGATFRLADQIGIMPLLMFADASESGLDSADAAGLAALYQMIRDCIDPEEWNRFRRHAIDTKAQGDDLLAFVKQVVEALAARPSSPPGNSSAGRQPTLRNLKDPSLLEGMVSPADVAR